MDTKNWYAWMDTMPPKPDSFHVVGEVYINNLGAQVELCPKVPQGINPNILLLDMHVVQRPGVWPQVMTWVQCHFDRVIVPGNDKYTDVEIYNKNELVGSVKVNEVC
jgi:hypothetical protein